MLLFLHGGPGMPEYLLGHSWGSFLGMQVAERAPDRFYAYIGMGQVTYQAKSEVLAYEYERQSFRENGNARMVRKLEAAPVTLGSPMPQAFRVGSDPVPGGQGQEV